MTQSRSWTGPGALVLVVIGLGWFVAYPLAPNSGVNGVVSEGRFTVDEASAPGIGSYLVNSSGFTLYIYVKDPGNGTSTCYGGCLAFWPAFYAGTKLTVPLGIEKSDFGVAKRTDGKLQTTYEGYPLYFFVKDKAPGQVNGQGDHGFYVCCKLPSPTTTSSTSSR